MTHMLHNCKYRYSLGSHSFAIPIETIAGCRLLCVLKSFRRIQLFFGWKCYLLFIVCVYDGVEKSQLLFYFFLAPFFILAQAHTKVHASF